MVLILILIYFKCFYRLDESPVWIDPVNALAESNLWHPEQEPKRLHLCGVMCSAFWVLTQFANLKARKRMEKKKKRDQKNTKHTHF